MDIRQITDKYHVSPQIEPGDASALAEAGFRLVICNRPDGEIPEPLHAEQVRAAVEAAGMTFAEHPLTHQTMTPENIGRQFGFVDDAAGPVLAYCATGTRCTVVWALSQAAHVDADEILRVAASAGYQLDGLRPRLDEIRADAAS